MKALVVGATGLVGKEIVGTLLRETSVTEVWAFSRRDLGFSDPKLRVVVVDFDRLNDWSHLLRGDVLFSSLGTTLKMAGSKTAQWKVDYDYQLAVARAASLNEVPRLVLISSTGADAKSPFFYLRMKGDLEDAVAGLGFSGVSILRPGMLYGSRAITRKQEVRLTLFLRKFPGFLLPSQLRPVDGGQVARVAVKAASFDHLGVRVISARDILGQ